MSSLDNKISDLRSKIRETNGEIAKVQVSIQNENKTISTLNDKINSLNTILDAGPGRLKDVFAKQDIDLKKISELETSLMNKNIEITQKQGVIDGLNDSIKYYNELYEIKNAQYKDLIALLKKTQTALDIEMKMFNKYQKNYKELIKKYEILKKKYKQVLADTTAMKTMSYTEIVKENQLVAKKIEETTNKNVVRGQDVNYEVRTLEQLKATNLLLYLSYYLILTLLAFFYAFSEENMSIVSRVGIIFVFATFPYLINFIQYLAFKFMKYLLRLFQMGHLLEGSVGFLV
jgi:chromosome segregation ATPase